MIRTWRDAVEEASPPVSSSTRRTRRPPWTVNDARLLLHRRVGRGSREKKKRGRKRKKKGNEEGNVRSKLVHPAAAVCNTQHDGVIRRVFSSEVNEPETRPRDSPRISVKSCVLLCALGWLNVYAPSTAPMQLGFEGNRPFFSRFRERDFNLSSVRKSISGICRERNRAAGIVSSVFINASRAARCKCNFRITPLNGKKMIAACFLGFIVSIKNIF